MGRRQQAVVDALSGHRQMTFAEIQRELGHATGNLYLQHSETQRVVTALLKRGEIERNGPYYRIPLKGI